MGAARWYLGVLLTAMAIGQALSWKGYRSAVAAYGLGRSSGALAALLFALEVVAAVGLLADPERFRLAFAILGVVVTALWTATAVQAYVRRRKVPNCACFGMFFRQRLRWWVLVEDVAFVGLAVIHLWNV